MLNLAVLSCLCLSIITLASSKSIASQSLKGHVEKLADKIGERNFLHLEALEKSAAYIESSLRAMGYQVRSQRFEHQGQKYRNLEVEILGAKEQERIIIVGAHYDSVMGSPGADDNATGVASLLALAEHFSGQKPDKTVRFVFFVNEEPPFFQTEAMGSWQYAKACRMRGEQVEAMISLETMGYFSDEPNSQNYPPFMKYFYPSKGNYIALVGNSSSRSLVKQIAKSFRKSSRIPLEIGALPEMIPGVGWSDHWSFWEHGYPGVMFTDTALYRNPHYHLESDTPEHINYHRLQGVIDGVAQAVFDLSKTSE